MDIRIQIFSDTDMNTNIFLTDTDMDMVWNLEPDPEVLKFRISVTLKYI
jgi:hypothetical protein